MSRPNTPFPVNRRDYIVIKRAAAVVLAPKLFGVF
jgi:hypothetical protein